MKILGYWKTILKDVDLSVFPQIYKMDLEKILFSDSVDVINTVEIKRIYELERQFEEWKKQYKERKVEKKRNIYFEPFYSLFIQFALDVLKDWYRSLNNKTISNTNLSNIGYI